MVHVSHVIIEHTTTSKVRFQFVSTLGILFDSEVDQVIGHVRFVHPVKMTVEDTARTEERIAERAMVLLALDVDFPHVALHGAPLLVGLVANETEVVAVLQHPHRRGHQRVDIGRLWQGADRVHDSHVLFNVTYPLDGFGAHKTLISFVTFADLILQQKLQVVGVIIICKE